MNKFIKNVQAIYCRLEWLVRRLSLYKLTVSANSLPDDFVTIRVVVLTV